MAMGCMDQLLPLLAMVIVQVIYAGANILSKLALDSGMEPYVFVTYHLIVATIAIAPFAIFLERNTWPQITRHILLLSLLCSVFGGTMHQLGFFFGLRLSTPIICVATVNTLPAITFIIAVIFRQEKVMIKERGGQAKVLGTCACVGGATLLAFYHGGILIKSESGIHPKFIEGNESPASHGKASGALLIIGSRVSTAIWLIIQTRLSRKFPAPFTNTILLCCFASLQCAFISVTINHKWSAWSIKSRIQLVAVLYAGVISSAVGLILTSWTAGKKGPLYVSVFGPFSLIVVAVLSWGVMSEKLYRGTLYGALLIMVGLYMVLWGKSQEQPEVHKAAKPADQGNLSQLEMANTSTRRGKLKETCRLQYMAESACSAWQ